MKRVFTLTVLLVVGLLGAGLRAGPRPIVGAIRWDAWSGGEVTVQVERTLGPEKYHDRLPWFAQVLDRDRVRIDGGAQEVMDQEIAFAAEAGLDYWAFLLYPESNSMSRGLERYLKSAVRKRIGFCLILHNALSVPAAQWPAERDRAVALLKEPGYQTVLDKRPLVFAFGVGQPGRVREFAESARKAGVDPYLVYMGWNPPDDFKKHSIEGFEAVSAYAHGGGQRTFGELSASLESGPWQRALKAQTPYIPLVTTGWDKQPRKDHPVSWERDHDYHRQAVFPAAATPREIAAHLGRAIAFVREHGEICPANAIVIYAWNEHDEGGWLCPTWTKSGKPNSDRLDAIRGVLKLGDQPGSVSNPAR